MPDKSKKQQRREAKELTEARRVTGPKLLRLVLKSAGFALVAALLLTTLGLIGPAFLRSAPVQLGVMALVYLLASPVLMSEFRPKKKR